MKNIVLAVAGVLSAFAITDSMFAAQVFTVRERGPHHRVWQSAPGPRGQNTRPGSYVELASGLHYWSEGQWQDSKEEIELFQDGAVARHGQYQVIFTPNINTVGAVDMLMPDGKRLRSRVMGLAYHDSVLDKSVLIAEVKDSIGQLVAANQVLYADAFTDINADVRYTYRRGSFEQDVIFHENPPAPETFGLGTGSTRIQVWTEFFDPPRPEKRQRAPVDRALARQKQALADEDIAFGAMHIARGRAFGMSRAMPAEAGIPENLSVPVLKEWGVVEGRSFLVESVSYPESKPLLDALPDVAAAVNQNGGNLQAAAMPRRGMSRAELVRSLVVQAPEQSMSGKKIEIAKASTQRNRGFVVDYESVVSTNNFTFQADTTYYVSGLATITGTATFEGGTVIKYANTNFPRIAITGTVNWQASPYRPVVLTARDDHSLGEQIGGEALSGYYAPTALDLDPFNPVDIQGLRISYAQIGIDLDEGNTDYLRDIQIINCQTAIKARHPTLNLDNALVYNCGTAFDLHQTEMNGQHITAHNVVTLSSQVSGSSLAITNCLLVAVTNLGIYTGTNVQAVSSDSGVFQTAGGGAHYLAAGSAYRNAGATNIPPSVRARLRQTTTYSPIVFSNATISVVTNFSVKALRDADTPDLGYHYDPLDYAFGGCHANVNVTFAPGIAVGWFRTESGWFHAGQGIHIADQKILTFDGRVSEPCYFVRCNVVQEGGNGLWEGGFGPGGITGWADQNLLDISLSPELRARFTRFSVMAYEGGGHFRDDNGYLIARATDCEFSSGGAAGYVLSSFFTNCLFQRTQVGQVAGLPGNEVHIRNCTWYGGMFYLDRSYTNIPVSIYDCAFDRTAISNDGRGNEDYNYNAYVTGSTTLSPIGSTNITVSSFDWQTGSLGRFYLPTNSALINTGSLTNAGLRGLYHFCSTTNNVKEANSVLNLAYHYVATTGGGAPIDTDGDTWPDYWEDRDGDGVVDSGETDWQTYTSPNGLSGLAGLQVFTPLK